VPAEEKERRKEFLLSLQQPIARRRLRGLRGETVEAIVEGPSDEHEYLLEAGCARRRRRSTGAS
jgi:tRNA A37 methylthiotransferase MiaB